MTEVAKRNPVPKSIITGINTNYSKAQDSAKSAINYAIKVGEFLIKAKEKVPHGEWVEWVQKGGSNLPFSSHWQTKSYMKLAKNKELAHVVHDKDSAFNLEDLNKAIANASEEDKVEAKTSMNMLSSESNEWYTPDHILERVFRTMGDVDLDPCSDPEGNVGADTIFTEEDDGLNQPWVGRVFMNPPYGGETGDWCRYLMAQNPDQAIVLISAAVGTVYFHELANWADAMWLGKGKLKFKPGAGAKTDGKNPTIYNAMFYKGSRVEDFHDEFSDIGKVFIL